jgi:hypothetical protein
MFVYCEELAIQAFFIAIERRRRAARKRKGSIKPPIKMSPAMVTAVRKRAPAVARRAELGRVHAVAEELLQHFFLVADAVGLDLYDPEYTYGEYVTLLLFGAAKRVRGDYPADPRGAWAEVERSVEPAADEDLDGDNGDESADGPTDALGRFVDPLQTHGHVLEVMAEWSDPMRSLALSVWADGLPITELAATLNASTNALNLRLRRARLRLSARTGAPLRLRTARSAPRGRLGGSRGTGQSCRRPGDSSSPVPQ